MAPIKTKRVHVTGFYFNKYKFRISDTVFGAMSHLQTRKNLCLLLGMEYLVKMLNHAWF